MIYVVSICIQFHFTLFCFLSEKGEKIGIVTQKPSASAKKNWAVFMAATVVMEDKFSFWKNVEIEAKKGIRLQFFFLKNSIF